VGVALHIIVIRAGTLRSRNSVTDDLLSTSCWGLAAARAHGKRLLAHPDPLRAARQLVTAIASRNPELRVRAADVARRITDKDPKFLAAHASEIVSVLAETPIAESRARWHLGLVVARTARTPAQIRLAAALLWKLSQDKSNVVRCSAVEGLGLLVLRDPSLRSTVEPYLEQAFAAGTPAMRVRARDALRALQPQHQTRAGRPDCPDSVSAASPADTILSRDGCTRSRNSLKNCAPTQHSRFGSRRASVSSS
jgi:hypothetical protein